MNKLLKILLAFVYGELIVDIVVDTLNFPFHSVYQGKNVSLVFDRNQREFLPSNTNGGYICERLSRAKLLKIAASFTFKKKFILRNGLTLHLVSVKAFKNGFKNAILAHFGYVMLNAEEYKTSRSVMDMLNQRNRQLMQDVGFLNEKVQSQEELLGVFSVQHRTLSNEVTGVRGELDLMKQKLGKSTKKLSNTTKELHQTQAHVKVLEKQVNALCRKFHIESAEQFLNRVLPLEDE